MKGVVNMGIINNVTITNYGGIEAISLPDGPITVVTGGNGHGKSTIVDAIRFLLTGKNGYTIKSGATEAVVEGEMFGSVFSRTMRPSATGITTEIRMNRRKVTGKAFEEWLKKNGIDPAALKIATSSEVLSAMSAGELSDFFIKGGYLPVKVTAEDVLDFLDLEVEEKEFLAERLPEDEFGLDEVNALYADLYELRKATKRFLVGQIAEVCKPKGDLVTLKTELEAVLKNEGASTAAKAAWAAYETAVNAVKAAVDQAAALRKEISLITETKDLSEEITAMKKKLSAARDLLTQLKGNLSTFKSQAKVNKELLDRLSSDACPLECSIVCKTDKTPIREKYQKMNDELSKQAQSCQERMTKGQELITSLEDALSKLETRQKEYEKRKTLEANLAKVVIPPTPEKPKVVKDTEDWTAKKSVIVAQIAACEKYETYLKQVAEQEKLQAKVKMLDHLIATLAPKGELVASIINLAVADLEEICNEQAAKIKTGYQLHFKAEDGLKITVTAKPGNPELEISALSTGERSIALLLVMDLLNQLSTGFRLLLIDDFEKFDMGNMAGLIKMIRDSSSDAIIGVVQHDEIVKALTPMVDHVVKI